MPMSVMAWVMWIVIYGNQYFSQGYMWIAGGQFYNPDTNHTVLILATSAPRRD